MILAFKNIDAFSDSSIISFEDGCGYRMTTVSRISVKNMLVGGDEHLAKFGVTG